MNNKYLLLFFISMLVGNVIVWFQTNSQLVWKGVQGYSWVMALAGVPLSLLFIKATYWGYHGFGEKLWPIRIAGFAIGMMVFSIMTALLMHELPDLKTVFSLVLCFAVILIQIFF